MKRVLNKCFRIGVVFALLGGMVGIAPAVLQAKANNEVAVDVTVRVHGQDINVSKDVMESSVEKLLEAAAIKVVDEGAGKGVVELEIDIYKDDDGDGFKILCDWDDDPEPEAEKKADTQDAIDDIVEDTVDEFIAFIKHAQISHRKPFVQHKERRDGQRLSRRSLTI